MNKDQFFVTGHPVHDTAWLMLRIMREKNDLELEVFELWERYKAEPDKRRQRWWMKQIERKQAKIDEILNKKVELKER